MRFKQLLFLLAILIFAHHSFAQFGFNSSGASPDNSAMVDISSETKGILVPRMTTAQRTAIASPATGLLVFDSDLKTFYFYNGTSWTGISSGTFTESDPKVGTLTTAYIPRWNGSTLANSAIYDNTGTRISIGTTTISPESRLALGASSGLEGGQLQLNGSTLSSIAYHLDNFDDAFRIMSGTNFVSSNVRLIIKNTGYIGIGTSDPTERLEVNGRIKTTKLQITDNATSGYVLQSDAAGYAAWVNPTTFSSVASSTLNYVPKWNGTALEDGVIFDDGTKIGIGTTTIAAQSRMALGAVDDNEGEGGQLQFNSASTKSVAYHLDTYDDAFRIMSGTNTGATDLRMYLSSAGNLGIGTGSPTGKLEVNGKTVTTNFQMTNGATNGYFLQSDASGNGSWVNSTSLSGASSLTSNYLPTWNGSSFSNSDLYYNNNRTSLGTTTTQFGGGLNYSKLTLGSNGSASSDLNIVLAENTNYAPYMNWGKARGTLTAMTSVQNGDQLLYLNANGHDGTTFRSSASIKVEVDGTPTTNSIPSRTSFFTTQVGSSSSNERMRIDNLGNVGIGTSSPSERLEVAGKTKTTNFQMTNAATNGYVLQSDASGNAIWVNPTTFGTSNWTTSGTNQYNTLSGNVGIGTTSPTEKLEVDGKTKTTNFQLTNGATNGYVLQSDASGNGSWVSRGSIVGSGLISNYLPKWNGSNFANSLIYDNSTGVGIGTPDIATGSGLALGSYSSIEGGQLQLNSGSSLTVGFYLDNYNESFRIMSGTNTTSINTRFQISSAGNVGIGTSASEKLEVAGKTKTTNFQMTNGAANNYVLTSDASGNASWATPSSSSNWTIAGSNQFSNISGNVGIGTSSPSTKLHVVGDATLAGTVNFNNNWNVQTGSDFNVEKSGTRYLTVYGTGGNVGIGTTAPNHKLDVQSTTSVTAQVQSSGAGAFLSTVAPPGQEASANFKTYSDGSGSSRWTVGKSTATEAGSNAGSNFFIDRHDDAGTYLGQPIAINRQDGTVTVGNDGASATKSTFKVNGSTEVKLTTINSNNNATSLGGNDYMVIYNGSISGNTLSLPAASSCIGRLYVVVNHSTSGVIITNTYIIANGTSSPTVSAGGIAHLVSDGSSWHKTN